MEKLTILGHIDGGIPIVMDLASELYGYSHFDIVKNIDRPDCPFPSNLYQASYFFDYDYDFGLDRDFPVQFGAHHGHLKYLLFNFFLEKHTIQKEQYINLVHSSSYFAPSANAGKGLMLEPLTVVSSMSQLGFGVTLKRSSSVGHHAILEDFVTINPGAVLSGFCSIGEGTEIGVGATISNNVKIGKRCLIGAGSVVTKDIPDGMIAFGNPCKPVRENERWGKIAVDDFTL